MFSLRFRVCLFRERGCHMWPVVVQSLFCARAFVVRKMTYALSNTGLHRASRSLSRQLAEQRLPRLGPTHIREDGCGA